MKSLRTALDFLLFVMVVVPLARYAYLAYLPWHRVSEQFTGKLTAKAYVYNCLTGGISPIITRAGKLGKEVADTNGVTLTDEQTERLIGYCNDFRGSKIRRFLTVCGYDPHHGYVIYGENKRVVAHISVCVTCGELRLRPDLAQRITDKSHRQIENLLEELGLPQTDYESYYARFHPEYQLRQPRKVQ